MRILGIDVGTKRVGVAMSDETGRFALPLKVISVGNLTQSAHLTQLIDEVVKIAREHSSTAIVVGESKNYKGEENAVMKHVTPFVEALRGQGMDVYMEPEFMTSVHAARFQGQNELHDASAAALILQSYLDRQPANQ